MRTLRQNLHHLLQVMKKPSKSPTVLLKQKVKERILTKSAGKVGKSEGPSTTSGEEIPADSDVPTVSVKRSFHPVAEEEITPQERREMLRELLARIPPVSGANHQSIVNKVDYTKPNPGAWLPVENHGSINDLARSVISKVKSAKPASDLDRLERSQLRGKPKGPSSTRSSE